MGNVEYGKIIASYRKASGLTQEELGKMLGIGSRAISAWEVGRNEPNMDMTTRLAKIFGCTVNDLMGRPDHNNGQGTFYFDREAEEIIKAMRERPELKTVFMAARDVDADSLKQIQRIIETFKNE